MTTNYDEPTEFIVSFTACELVTANGPFDGQQETISDGLGGKSTYARVTRYVSKWGDGSALGYTADKAKAIRCNTWQDAELLLTRYRQTYTHGENFQVDPVD